LLDSANQAELSERRINIQDVHTVQHIGLTNLGLRLMFKVRILTL